MRACFSTNLHFKNLQKLCTLRLAAIAPRWGMLRHARLALAGRVLAPRAVRALARPMSAAAPPRAPSGARSSWFKASSVRGLGVRPGTLVVAAGRRAHARQYGRTCTATENLGSGPGNLFSAEEVTDTSMTAEQNKEKAAALRLLNKLLKKCGSSPKIRRIIATDMPAAGVEPNVVTFTTLVSQLMFEGDWAGAQRVVEEEMPAAGVEPDDRTLETLNKSEREFAYSCAGVR